MCPSRLIFIASPSLWDTAGYALQRCAARLLLHVAPHGHLGGPASIDVAGVVHANAFRRAGLDRRLWNKRGDLAVLDAADADALLEARIVVVLVSDHHGNPRASELITGHRYLCWNRSGRVAAHLGPSCVSRRRSSNVNSLGGRNSA